MDIFNKARVVELERQVAMHKQEADIYRARNKQLEQFEQEVKDAQLKIKVMQMLIDDDEAILELLEAKKVKVKEVEHINPMYAIRSAEQARHQQNMALYGAQASAINAGGFGFGGLAGIAGQSNNAAGYVKGSL